MNFTPLESEINVTGLVSAFHYNFQKGFHYDGEKHKGWEFAFVDSGRIAIKADERKYIVKSGEMVCHKPMEFHTLSPYHGDASVIIFCFYCSGEKMLYFENKILSVDARQRCYPNDIVTHAEAFLSPKEPLQIVKDGYMQKSSAATPENSQFIKNSIELLILSLYSSRSTEVQQRVNSYSQYLKRKNLTENIKSYLRQNLGGPISLAGIAEEYSYSVSTVKTVFKEETGKSVIAYYNDLRLSAARELLLKKDNSVSEISELLGFNNPAHFSNFFKKATGTSPKNYSVGS